MPQWLDEAGDAVRNVIRAYHGSPYDFNKFDAAKISTGQGAQSYGHGLYFTSAEPVADTYRSSVSALQRTPQEDAMEFWRRQAEISGDKQKAVLDALTQAEESMEEAAGMTQAQDRWKEIIGHLYALDYRQPLPKRPGNMYEVEIAYPESSLLDWNAPLSKQPKAVQDAYAGTGGSFHGMRDARNDGERLWWNRRMSGTGEMAAKELLEAGVPGIRYTNAGANRIGGDGARNYVMFPGTEDQIRILRKYGLMAPIAAGAAAGASEQPAP